MSISRQGPKTALIGCGRIGFLLENDPLRYKPCTHYGGAMAAGLKIHLACDILQERLKLFGQTANLKDEALYTDYGTMLRQLRPETVIIATWTESHADIGICAAENGARVIICEKPLASNLQEASRLLKVCNQRGVRLIINHERRYDHRYNTAKRLIDRGKIGTIKTVHASILSHGYRGPSHPGEGGGPLMHDGTHMADILRFFLGPIISVQGEFQRQNRRRGYEDRATAWLKTAGGVDIFLEAGGNRHYFLFELRISGTEGAITIGNGYESLFLSQKSTLYTNFRDLKAHPFPSTKGESCFTREYREVKKLLKDETLPITSEGLDGYKAIELIHAIYLSSYIRKRVDLPLKPDSIDLNKIFNL